LPAAPSLVAAIRKSHRTPRTTKRGRPSRKSCRWPTEFSRQKADTARTQFAGGDKYLHSVRRRYILNTPNFVSGIGAFNVAANARASTRRVSDGVMMPSSQRRAVA
jgi:hypothetical protein